MVQGYSSCWGLSPLTCMHAPTLVHSAAWVMRVTHRPSACAGLPSQATAGRTPARLQRCSPRNSPPSWLSAQARCASAACGEGPSGMEAAAGGGASAALPAASPARHRLAARKPASRHHVCAEACCRLPG